ncbi:hypothetical protein BKI52_09185 [marine bacterium AO1-C]|nr:hypothetical protein BKI52_09185 [marine bacterium AO1-C]
MLNFSKITVACIAMFMSLLAFSQATIAQIPKYSGKVTLPGLQQNVEVFFDRYGIPHIYAKNVKDAYFALGFVQAQERIAQFEVFRRLGTGTLAEVSQDAGAVSSDVAVRTVGIVESARQTVKAFKKGPNTDYKKALKSYLAGINAYLATITDENRPKDLPKSTPQQYTLEDLFSTFINFQFGFTSLGIHSDALTTQLKNILGNPAYFEDLSVQTGKPVNKSFFPQTSSTKSQKHKGSKSSKVMDRALFKALTSITTHYEKYGLKNSNGYAIAGEKSTTGKPFFSSDGHIGLSKPDLFYEAQVVYPGQDLYGLFFPFSIWCLIGHTQKISWGVTVMLNDDVDLYRETINPHNPNQVMFNGHWVDLETRIETIKILQNDGTLKDSTFEVKVTPHGAIISNVNGFIAEDPVSLFNVPFRSPDRTQEAFFGINNANNLQQFKKAAKKHIGPGYNVQYADKNNNIAWFAVAKLLKRPEHVNSKVILDGASGNDEPLGFYKFNKNPRSVNPSSGFIYSANNQIGKVDGKLYPGYYVAGTRAKVLKKKLKSQAVFSSEDLQKLFKNTKSSVFKKLKDNVLHELQANPVLAKSANHQKAANILRNWKGKHGVGAKGPVVFYQLYFQLLKSIFEDEIGPDVFEVFFQGGTPLYDVVDRSFVDILNNESSIWYDNVTTHNKHESREDIFAEAFDNTVQKLVETGILGNTWGEVHTQLYESFPALFLVPEQLSNFNLGPFPFAGGINVLNKSELDLFAVGTAGDYSVAKTSGAGNRTLVDFSDINNKSLGVIPTGQSGVPESPFYQDQASLYNSGQLRPMLGERSDIESQSSKLVLEKPLPPAPNVGEISGAKSICPGDNIVKYSVDEVASADQYIWVLPDGVSQKETGKKGTIITSTSIIEVDFGIGFTGGSITVAAKNNTLGVGSKRSITIEKCQNGRASSLLVQEIAGKKVMVFPNPVAGVSKVKIQVGGTENNAPILVQIVDSKGNTKAQFSRKLVNGSYFLDANNLSNGMNILKIKLHNQIFSFQLIKAE